MVRLDLLLLGCARDAKELVHVLERSALGLGDEEPDEDEHGEGEGTKDQVRARETC